MTDIPYPDDPGRTHSSGCWRHRGHHACAIRLLESVAHGMRGVVEAIRTHAGYETIEAVAYEMAESTLRQLGFCAWQHPEQPLCSSPASDEKDGVPLCRKHASIVELAREPLRPAE